MSFVVELHWENSTVALLKPISSVSAVDVCKSHCRFGVDSKFQPSCMILSFHFFLPEMGMCRENISTKFEALYDLLFLTYGFKRDIRTDERTAPLRNTPPPAIRRAIIAI